MKSFIFLSSLKKKCRHFLDHTQPARFFWLIPAVFLALVRYCAPKSPKEIPRRIIILHFGGLGDLLMMTPSVRALKRKFPEAQIDLWTSKQMNLAAFADHPDYNRVFLLNKLRLERFREIQSPLAAFFKTLYFYPKEYCQLFVRNYDVSIHIGLMFSHWRGFANAFLYSLGIPTRIGLKEPEAWVNTDSIEEKDRQNGRKLFMSFLKPFQLENEPTEIYYPILKKVTHPVIEKVLAAKEMSWAILHPGGIPHINSRRWPVENFADVGRYLLGRNLKVLISGGHSDAEVCSELERKLNASAINICGRMDFKEIAYLLSLCKLCVTNDTSIIHLAEAAKIPRVFAVFGPTDPWLLLPPDSRYKIFQANLECVPCQKTMKYKDIIPCPREIKSECLELIRSEEVIREIARVL